MTRLDVVMRTLAWVVYLAACFASGGLLFSCIAVPVGEPKCEPWFD